MPKKKVKTVKKVPKKRNKVAKPKKGHDSEHSIKSLVVVKRVVYASEPVPEQYIFHLHDGRVIRHLNDLINVLDTMTDDLFNYHANSERNDFSNWIRDIIDENDLSLNICGKSREDTQKEVIKFLKKRGAFKG